MSVISRRLSAANMGMQDKLSKAMAEWDALDDPADIEEAVLKFIPEEEPLRSASVEALAKALMVDIGKMGEESDMIGAIVQAATLRVVHAEHQSGRRSMSRVSQSAGRVSVDDTLDIIKLVVVGDSGVGKTCLMLRFIKDEFVTSTRATVGMDFCARQLSVDLLTASENSVVQRLTVQVWDTAGQEQFHSLTATYYRKAGGVMIVYDAQNRASFDSLDHWLEQVEQHAEGVVKMIVATKSEGAVAVSEDEGRAFAKRTGCLFAATSSKLGEGVLNAFKVISSHVLAAEESRDEAREGLWLNSPLPGLPEQAPKKGGCC